MDVLLAELSLIQARSAAAKKVVDSLNEFETYIRNNREFIPNFGEQRRPRKRSARHSWSQRSTRWKSTVCRCVRPPLATQTRTKVLNNELDEVFRRWHPQFRPQEKAAALPPTLCCTPDATF